MTNKARPLSPHLQIYRLPLVAITSITHRITGVGLAAGLLLLSCWLGAAAHGPDSYLAIHSLIVSPIGRIVMLGFTLSLFFHLTNGIRHLVWDAGLGLDLASAQSSNRTVIAATIILTAIAWLIALA